MSWSGTRFIRSPLSQRDRRVAGAGHRQLHELRLHFLAEAELLGAVEVRAALELAVDLHLELVIPRRHVVDVDPLHAPLAQGFELLEAVDVEGRELAVDEDLHRIEPHRVALGQRDEDGNLRPRWVQQLFLETAQLRRDAEDVRLDLLDLLVEALHLLLLFVALLLLLVGLLLLFLLLLLLRLLFFLLLRPAGGDAEAEHGSKEDGEYVRNSAASTHGVPHQIDLVAWSLPRSRQIETPSQNLVRGGYASKGITKLRTGEHPVQQGLRAGAQKVRAAGGAGLSRR